MPSELPKPVAFRRIEASVSSTCPPTTPSERSLEFLVNHRFRRPFQEATSTRSIRSSRRQHVGLGLSYVPFKNLEAGFLRSRPRGLRGLRQVQVCPPAGLRVAAAGRGGLPHERSRLASRRRASSRRPSCPRLRFARALLHLCRPSRPGRRLTFPPFQQNVLDLFGAVSIAVTRTFIVHGEIVPRATALPGPAGSRRSRRPSAPPVSLHDREPPRNDRRPVRPLAARPAGPGTPLATSTSASTSSGSGSGVKDGASAFRLASADHRSRGNVEIGRIGAGRAQAEYSSDGPRSIRKKFARQDRPVPPRARRERDPHHGRPSVRRFTRAARPGQFHERLDTHGVAPAVGRLRPARRTGRESGLTSNS